MNETTIMEMFSKHILNAQQNLLPLCPGCKSINIENTKTNWVCSDCSQTFTDPLAIMFIDSYNKMKEFIKEYKNFTE